MNISPKSLQIGGRIYDAAEVARFESGTTGVILYGVAETIDRYTTMRLANGTAGYQVGASKVLTVSSIICSSTSGTVQSAAALCYGDTDVGRNSASAPTTPIYLAGHSAAFVKVAHNYSSSSSTIKDTGTYINFQVPASKYLAMISSQANLTCIAYCFIDDV